MGGEGDSLPGSLGQSPQLIPEHTTYPGGTEIPQTQRSQAAPCYGSWPHIHAKILDFLALSGSLDHGDYTLHEVSGAKLTFGKKLTGKQIKTTSSRKDPIEVFLTITEQETLPSQTFTQLLCLLAFLKCTWTHAGPPRAGILSDFTNRARSAQGRGWMRFLTAKPPLAIKNGAVPSIGSEFCFILRLFQGWEQLELFFWTVGPTHVLLTPLKTWYNLHNSAIFTQNGPVKVIFNSHSALCKTFDK